MLREVVLVCSHYMPENTAATERLVHAVEGLCQDFKVKVYCLAPKGKFSTKQEFGPSGEEIYRLQQTSYSGNLLPVRGFFEFIYSLVLLFQARREGRDKIYMVSSPFLFLQLLAPILLPQSKYNVLDLRDMVWAYLPKRTRLQRMIRKLFGGWARRSLKCFEKIIVNNESQLELVSSTVSPQRVILIPNGISRARFEGLNELGHRFSRKFRVLVSGNIGNAQHLETIIQAAREVQDLEIHIVGGGNQLERLKLLVQSMGLESVFFYGHLDWKHLKDLYEMADILYLQIHPDYQSSRPVRFYEYLATGLPILLSAEGETSEFARNIPGVIQIPSCDVGVHREFLSNLIRSGLETWRYSTNRNFIEKSFIREEISKRFSPVLKEIFYERDFKPGVGTQSVQSR